MTEEAFECTYERIAPTKRIPYWVFWSLLGVLVFLVTEALAQIYGVDLYRVARISASILIALMPSAFIWFSRAFQETMQDVSRLMWSDKDPVESWMKERLEKAFTLSTWLSRVTVALVVIFATVTFMQTGPLYTPVPLNAAAYIEMTLMFAIGAQSLYLMVYMSAVLREIVRFPLRIPFFMVPHPAVTSLQRLYWAAVFRVSIAYVILAIGAWGGPLGLGAESLIWLTFLGLFPISMFFWSVAQIHSINQKAKESHLKFTNNEVQRAVESVRENEDLNPIDTLDGIMSIQIKVQSMRVWPLEWQGALTFLVTLLLAIIQIAIAVNELRSP